LFVFFHDVLVVLFVCTEVNLCSFNQKRRASRDEEFAFSCVGAPPSLPPYCFSFTTLNERGTRSNCSLAAVRKEGSKTWWS